MDLDRWKSQLRKGAVELAVLAVLERKDRYGLEILEAVSARGGLEISAGTIYPLLNRLQKDEKIEARWVEDEGASHPRKYYTLTRDGRSLLAEMRTAWNRFHLNLSALLEEAS